MTTTSTASRCSSGSTGPSAGPAKTSPGILAKPAAFNFPCTWPEPIDVVAQPLGTPLKWQEYAFTLEAVHGHTRWSNLIFFQADGRRICATGDQHFFHKFTGANAPPTDYDGSSYYANWVYRNGAMLSSMRDSYEKLLARRPELILPGHGNAYRTNDQWYAQLQRLADCYEEIHRRAMPLGENDAHFEVDSRGGWLEPYRTHVPPAGTKITPGTMGGGVIPRGMIAEDLGPLKFRAFVRNPLPRRAELTLRLAGPEGWSSRELRLPAGPREEISCELEIAPPRGAVCRRQPVALELTVEDRPFGQIAEALVTIGYERL